MARKRTSDRSMMGAMINVFSAVDQRVSPKEACALAINQRTNVEESAGVFVLKT
jgi:hypothetical protein